MVKRRPVRESYVQFRRSLDRQHAEEWERLQQQAKKLAAIAEALQDASAPPAVGALLDVAADLLVDRKRSLDRTRSLANVVKSVLAGNIRQAELGAKTGGLNGKITIDERSIIVKVRDALIEDGFSKRGASIELSKDLARDATKRKHLKGIARKQKITLTADWISRLTSE